ncbi:MAG: aldehyde dehydrogenase family protein [Candidatus Methanomethylophilaceae archaeon]
MKVYSPVDLRQVGEVEETRPEDVEGIVQSCRDSQKVWVSIPNEQRAECLQRLTRQVAERSEEIAYTVHLETGKPRLEGLNTEVMASAASCQHAALWRKRFRDDRKVNQGRMGTMLRYLGRRSIVNYRPLGVIGVISPFNFPFSIPFTQTVTAVAAGNGVVLKPSSETPLTGMLISQLFQDAGFPEGLVSVVCGPGTGDALARSSVDKVVFTGSGEVGRKVMRSASDRLTPSIMELGGKDAMIVLRDADLDRASSAAAWGAFVNSGQVCVGIKRIYVQDDVMDDFLDMLVRKTKELKQGDGWQDADVSLGPMINEKAVKEMERQVHRALEQGGRILLGGNRNPDLPGHFFLPTIVTGLSQDADLIKEETFGPIVAILPFREEEEALKLANESPFALSGSIWTQDLREGRRLASLMRSGTVMVNNAIYTYGLPATPWGGRGESGFGRTHGEWGFLEMMETHHIHLDAGKMPRDFWWFPYDEEKGRSQMFFMRLFFLKDRKGLFKGLMDMRSIMKRRS